MAEKFQPQTFDINSINSGNRYGLEGIQPEAVNAPIEAAAYVQSLATNQPNVENADKVGSPTVSIELAPNGTPRFKFENLKGETGTDNSQEIDEINSNITAIKKEQSEQNSQIEATKKEVHNIKQALLQNEVLVVSKIENKTTMRITAGGENIVDGQYTAVTEIKGSTVRNENLISYPYKNTDGVLSFPITINGVTFTENNGEITANGTATAEIWFRISTPITLQANTKYFVDGAPIGGTVNSYSLMLSRKTESGAQVQGGYVANGVPEIMQHEDATNGTMYIVIRNGAVVTNAVFKPLLVEGETGTWTPPFNDLKHANIKAIKSTGRNLFDLNLLGSWLTKDSTDENYFVFKGGTTDLIKLFDEPKNIYAKIKYKAYDTTSPANERGAFPKFIRNNGTEFELGTYLNRDGETSAYIENVVGMKFTFGSYHKNTIGEFIISFEDVPFESYTEDIYELLQELIALYPNGIPEYDRFYPQTGELIRQTGYATSETGFTEEEIAGYDGAIVSSDKLSLEYKLATPTIEKIENAPKLYKAWNKGSETVIQGEKDNSIYGAMPTITNEYILKIGGETE